jgi:GNAT superfamily N-acetyltransferase
MTTAMTDPTNALTSFQQALAQGIISPQQAELHDDLLFLVDDANGETRFTYALLRDDHVVALANFIPADPLEGFPCLSIGYAVDESHRSKGLGKVLVQKAFDELTNGFKRAQVPHLYVEAIISVSNEHSKKLANSVISSEPAECTDGVSGEPALQYIKQLF